MTRKILFLAANPRTTNTLGLPAEAREITQVLRASRFRDDLELATAWAAQPQDLQSELSTHKPAVLHFSGHGDYDGLQLETTTGDPHVVPLAAVGEVLGAANAGVRVVVLNACYSDQGAEALLPYVDCVVAMNGPVRDVAAKDFAVGFYRALGNGESVGVAFRQGCASITINASGPTHTRDVRPSSSRSRLEPRLCPRTGIDPESLILVARAHRPDVPIPCPYPGLTAFSRTDSARFFGRRRQIRELAQKLEDVRFVLAIGPSGSGKSSLVEAGLLPAIEATSSEYVIRTLQTSASPSTALRNALGSDAAGSIRDAAKQLLSAAGRSRLVLFVDQLERLFTIAEPDERSAFCAALHELRELDCIRVVAAARADFYGALMDSAVWELFEYGRYDVAPLRDRDLRDAIESPARARDVKLDDALVAQLAYSTQGEPGGLPCLQATLVDLWEDMNERRSRGAEPAIALEDYQRLAGLEPTSIAAALSRRADAAIATLSSARRQIARRLLLSLVSFGTGRAHTRQQQQLASLQERENSVDLAAVIKELVDRRLVTVGLSAGTIDLSHDALIGAWPTLRDWIAQHQADEQRRRALEDKVREWRAVPAGDDTGAKLLDAVELLDAEHYVAEKERDVGKVDGLHALVAKSRDALEAIRRQRDEAHRLVAMHAQERGRQLLQDRRPMAALPYFLASREAAERAGAPAVSRALQLMFAAASRSAPVAAFVHRDAIERVAFSPDGARAVTACFDGNVFVWEPRSGKLVLPPLEHPGAVLDIAFSEDGSLATACADGRARIWTSDGLRRLELAGHSEKVHIVSLSRDGTMLLTASWDKTCVLWRVADGKQLTEPIVYGRKILCARFSPDGRHFVVGGAADEAHVYAVETMARVASLQHTELIRTIAFTSDGSRVVTASADKTARIWEPLHATPLTTLEHPGSVAAAELSADGEKLVAVCDSTAHIWDVRSNKRTALVEHHAPITTAHWSPDAKSLVTASLDRTVRISNAATGDTEALPFEHTREVTHLAVDRSGSKIITASSDGVARVWNTSTGVDAHVPLRHRSHFLWKVVFDRAGERIATLGEDGTARLWNVGSGESLATFEHEKGVTSAMFSADGTLLLTSTASVVTVWDVAKQTARRGLAHDAAINTAQLAPSGTTVVTAYGDGLLRIWDLVSDEVREQRHSKALTGAWFGPDELLVTTCADGAARIGTRIFRHDHTVTHAAFDHRGVLLATASRDGTARVWNVKSGEPETPPIAHAGPVRRVAFSPDATRLLTIAGNTVRVWDVTTGRPVLDAMEHATQVHVARFSPDGTHIATGSDAVYLWDGATGRTLVPPLLHATRVNDVAFSPNGRFLASAGADAIGRLWMLPFDEWSTRDWIDLVDRSPYTLVKDALVERTMVPVSNRLSRSG